MADKKKEPKVVLEREYNIPLRRKFMNAPKYKRSKKAIKTVREFISKHMKTDIVRVGRFLNLHVWKHGIKNPPHHVAVIAKKHDDGAVDVEFKGAPAKKEEKKAETKPTPAKPAAKPVEAKPALAAKPAEAKSTEPAKPAEKKPEVKAEAKPAPAKPAEKKE